MSGRMILLNAGQTMGKLFVFCLLLTNIAGNALLCMWRVVFGLNMLCMFWQTCLLRIVSLVISAPITVQNLLPNRYGSGCKMLVCKHSISNLAALGKMGIAKALTENCVPISLMVKFLRHYKRPKYSLEHGENTTTHGDRILHSAADHLHR